LPERQLNARPVLQEVMANTSERWSIRRGRLRIAPGTKREES
jgi:hypothetical protein